MTNLNHYLDYVHLDNALLEFNQIQDREQLNEVIGPIMSTIFDYLSRIKLESTTKIDKPLTTKFRKLMSKVCPNHKYEGKWQIRIVNEAGPNAFTFGKKDIYMTNSFIRTLTQREIEAVLLHEVGHVVNFDIAMRTLAESAVGGVGIAAFVWFIKSGSLDPKSKYVVHVFLIMCVLAPAMITTAMMSKKAEYRADNYAAKLGYAKELTSSLKKLNVAVDKFKKDNNIDISKKKQPCKTNTCKILRKISQTFDTHPETEDRVKAMKPYVLQKAKALDARLKSQS